MYVYNYNEPLIKDTSLLNVSVVSDLNFVHTCTYNYIYIYMYMLHVYNSDLSFECDLNFVRTCIHVYTCIIIHIYMTVMAERTCW